MTLQDEYNAALAAWHEERSRVLSDRLTLSRKEAQMHEADVEQDDAVADYFANRKAEMEQRVAEGEAYLASLAAHVEEVRILMVTEELAATMSAYRDVMRAVERQIAALRDHVSQATALSQHAEELAESLPQSASRHHQSAATLVEQSRVLDEILRQLQAAIAPTYGASAPPPASGRGVTQ